MDASSLFHFVGTLILNFQLYSSNPTNQPLLIPLSLATIGQAAFICFDPVNAMWSPLQWRKQNGVGDCFAVYLHSAARLILCFPLLASNFTSNFHSDLSVCSVLHCYNQALHKLEELHFICLCMLQSAGFIVDISPCHPPIIFAQCVCLSPVLFFLSLWK